jgi:hypothetical protein
MLAVATLTRRMGRALLGGDGVGEGRVGIPARNAVERRRRGGDQLRDRRRQDAHVSLRRTVRRHILVLEITLPRPKQETDRPTD